MRAGFIITACFFAASCGDSSEQAQVNPKSSAQYAAAGRRTWEAFECTAYASYAGEQVEAQRLAELGISEGRTFLRAVEDGAIQQEDYSHTVPVGLTAVLGGPSHDFILGRIHETVMQYAIDRVYEQDLSSRVMNPDQEPPTEAERQENARRFMDEANCRSLR